MITTDLKDTAGNKVNPTSYDFTTGSESTAVICRLTI